MGKKAVIALGGNALIKKGQTGTIYEQFANTRQSMQTIVKLIQQNWNILITHGNGPQVGAIFLQNQNAQHLTPPMPLGICVAESQGLIGYMIQQSLLNELQKKGIAKQVLSIITQVVVDAEDPKLQQATKPIGPYFTQDQAKELQKQGYHMVEHSRGWRIMVPSPDPKRIVEAATIKKLVQEGVIVIASGGGGLPVEEKKGWGYDGIEAVIDKDLSAAKLATDIEADELIILTDVEKIFLHYNTPQQQSLETVKLSDLKKFYADYQFPEGSMGPKVLAAIRFIENGGKKVIISHIEKGWDAVQGNTGTHITK